MYDSGQKRRHESEECSKKIYGDFLLCSFTQSRHTHTHTHTHTGELNTPTMPKANCPTNLK